MKILVINAGSSSVKFQLFSMKNEDIIVKGQIERIGSENPNLIYKRFDGKEIEEVQKFDNYKDAFKIIASKLTDPEIGVIKTLDEVEAIGHRVVHGGEKVTKPALVTAEIEKIIQDCFSLAPLHNPPNFMGIQACREMFTDAPNVAVFDTAFHQTMQPESYLYAVPYELYEKHSVRRYGFHGTSHNFVADATAKMLNTTVDKLKLITCHIGNGCSITAIENGKVIDTSMGMTPLEGLVMGTRCGDIDPAIIFKLIELGKTPEEIDKMLNKQSGLLGVSGVSSDMRDIITAAESGNERAALAMQLFVRRIIKYTGAYYALLKGADAFVFTGGIGEYSIPVRKHVINGLSGLGLNLNKKENEACFGKQAVITTESSSWKAIVMPTNEELMIAKQTLEIVNG